ncbi:MAG TPA: sigma-70 family RNA polymerase sigma factor [Friedmanniella sp.]
MDDVQVEDLRTRALVEPGAMEDLLAALQPLVRARCARLLPCPADAEEAAQDALLAVATRLGTFRGSGSFTGWVVVVASNAARGTYRSLKRRSQERPHVDLAESVDPRTTSVIAGSRLDLLDAVEQLEEAHPELVESFVLRDLAGLTYAEVARETGVPLGTAQARVHRGRQFVRRRLLPDR